MLYALGGPAGFNGCINGAFPAFMLPKEEILTLFSPAFLTLFSCILHQALNKVGGGVADDGRDVAVILGHAHAEMLHLGEHLGHQGVSHLKHKCGLGFKGV